MKTFFYWFFVVFSIVAIISVNLIFDFRLGVVAEFFLCLIVIIAPSIILNFTEKFFPKKWYGEQKKLYRERAFEKVMFEKINVKKWKDNVPQFLKIANINKTNEKIDKNYIEFFITETRRGEFMHLLDIIFGIANRKITNFYIFSTITPEGVLISGFLPFLRETEMVPCGVGNVPLANSRPHRFGLKEILLHPGAVARMPRTFSMRYAVGPPAHPWQRLWRSPL